MVLAVVKIGFLASLVLTGPVSDTIAPDSRPAAPAVAALSDAMPMPEPASLQETADATALLPPADAASTPSTGMAAAPALAEDAAVVVAQGESRPDAAASRTEQQDHTPAQPVQDALAQASSRSAVTLPRLLGNSVAYATDLPPVPNVAPPVPNIKPMESPITPERVVRPDEITPQAPPPPTVSPYVSPDSAAQKQAELNRREQELLALQQQMEARMSELHGLENRIQGMLQDANTTQDSKLKQLVDMYANMKARQAAKALTDMDETIAVKILTGMKSKQSGEILSYMDPKHAARLSEVMTKMQM